ncbi:MAG: ribose-phosphate diphosphokinase [Acidobacteriota bacterium]
MPPPTADSPPPILFSTPSYRELAREILARGGVEEGDLESRVFPDGEHYRRLRTRIAGRRVVLLAGTIDDIDTLALYDLACTAAKGGALALSLVIPYFGYSTQERATCQGEVVTAKSRARLLSSIPLAHHGNEVLLLELHTGGLPHYFEGPITAVHLSAQEIVVNVARRLAGDHEMVVGSVDTGRAKQVEALAGRLGAQVAFVFKRRLDGETTRVAAVAGDVRGKTVVIYDDMIRTGGSLLGAGRAYLDAGAKRLVAVAVHGVLPGAALERLEASGLFERIVVTDSHPRARQLAASPSSCFEVESVAPLLHRALVNRSTSAI